jgi:hypothetical protein
MGLLSCAERNLNALNIPTAEKVRNLPVVKLPKIHYSVYIIHKSSSSNFSDQNWTLKSFAKEEARVGLFLKLTAKNVAALSFFPVDSVIHPEFKTFCVSYKKLEEEYTVGIQDHTKWANYMLMWGDKLHHWAKE